VAEAELEIEGSLEPELLAVAEARELETAEPVKVAL
jgi:hypothetical protein